MMIILNLLSVAVHDNSRPAVFKILGASDNLYLIGLQYLHPLFPYISSRLVTLTAREQLEVPVIRSYRTGKQSSVEGFQFDFHPEEKLSRRSQGIV